jgi:hypothetical protein
MLRSASILGFLSFGFELLDSLTDALERILESG